MVFIGSLLALGSTSALAQRAPRFGGEVSEADDAQAKALEQAKQQLAADPAWIAGTNSFSPLCEALSKGQLEVARFLLEHGADPNNLGDTKPYPNAYEWPLNYALACSSNWRPLAELLVHSGAKIDNAVLYFEYNSDGSKAQSEANRERLLWLIDNGFDLNTPTG